MNYIEEKLALHKQNGNYRELYDIDSIKLDTIQKVGRFINFSSNDYLGLAENMNLRNEFLELLSIERFRLSTSSSRLLTGNTCEFSLLENDLAKAYNAEAALLFGCGYHANTGIIPAITDKETLILADKLIHASIIDGIRLSESKCIRYKHLDYSQLERLIEENHNSYRSILIITESIFSMDGDESDIKKLVIIKKRYSNVSIYIDEAHSFGVRGTKGLGCCEDQDCTPDIDYIVGTFGKALASIGAFVICSQTTKEYLINRVRPFIFTTALPPVNIAWTRFLFNKLPEFSLEREHLKMLSEQLHKFITRTSQPIISNSHIIPFIIGDNNESLNVSENLKSKGIFILPIRPPAVPKGTARLRISLSANNTLEQINYLITELENLQYDLSFYKEKLK